MEAKAENDRLERELREHKARASLPSIREFVFLLQGEANLN